MNDNEFANLMGSLKGGISTSEGLFLKSLAAQVEKGCIVEVGSYRGKSAVAIGLGIREKPENQRPKMYCIEPHRPFVGLYGGVFGPVDRGHFYEVMLRTGLFQDVALINQTSDVIAPGWKEPVELLFIDGDHRYEGVRDDFVSWESHVLVGGLVAFDDAKDPAGGPHRLIQEIVDSGEYGQYRNQAECGKIVVLKKVAQVPKKRGKDSRPALGETVTSTNPKRIVVACENLILAGGLLRFARAGSLLSALGHDVCFLALSNRGAEWKSPLPVLTLNEARSRQWDVVMVPGAGFSNEIIERFQLLQEPCFGLRVQHILNDQSRRNSFINVNRKFAPHIVLFNNEHWTPGSWTEFKADRFHYLIGAVDIEQFRPRQGRQHPLYPGRWIIGGLANKNPVPLIEALRLLPPWVHVVLYGKDGNLKEIYGDLLAEGRLQLMGPLFGTDLAEFYNKVDCVVMTEQNAGWSNLVAEAMASGVPVVCTRAGTGRLALNEETAVVIPSAEPALIADAVLRLVKDKALCTSLATSAYSVVKEYTWEKYCRELLDLLEHNSVEHYTWAPDWGLYGKWPLSVRTEGVQSLLGRASGATVLDLGAAEGVIARLFLEAGADLVHGFELVAGRVSAASSLCQQWSRAKFFQGDLSNWNEFRSKNKAVLLEQYDIVLYLGLHHHLPQEERVETLVQASRMARKYFAIRTPESFFVSDRVESRLDDEGFRVLQRSEGDERAASGAIRIYVREAEVLT